jgi:hypothetical protein
MSCGAHGAFPRRPDASFSDVLGASAPKRKSLWRCWLMEFSWGDVKQTMRARRAWSALQGIEDAVGARAVGLKVCLAGSGPLPILRAASFPAAGH